MVDLSLYAGGSYFTAADVEHGPKVLTITGCEQVVVRNQRGEEAEKWVLTFDESPKRLILRKSILDRLVADFGTSETDEWVGQQVELFAVDTSFGGRPTKGIRARKYVPEE